MELTQADKNYYLDNYQNYDLQNPNKKLKHYKEILSQYCNPLLPQTIHDIGCGPGNFLHSLYSSSEFLWEVSGSDINSYAISKIQQKIPGGRFTVGSGCESLLFKDPFAIITAFDVLEHVRDLDKALNFLEKQLMKGGLLVFVVPVYDGLSGPLIKFLDKDPTHIHKKPRQFWLNWVSQKFEILYWEGIVRYLLPNGFYIHLPTTRIKYHTPAILVACRAKT